jgi:hypothetical protein
MSGGAGSIVSCCEPQSLRRGRVPQAIDHKAERRLDDAEPPGYDLVMIAPWKRRIDPIQSREASSPQELTVVATRRRSDFEAPQKGVTLLSPGCCCCCCLHWAGAVIGGGLAYRWAWKREDMRPEVRQKAHLAFALGLGLTIFLTAVMLASDADWLMTGWGFPLALLPFLVFLPSALLVVASLWLSVRTDLPHRIEHIDRAQQPDPIDDKGAYRGTAIEEKEFIDLEAHRLRTRSELRGLARVGIHTLLYSFLGTVLGYLVMLLLLALN